MAGKKGRSGRTAKKVEKNSDLNGIPDLRLDTPKEIRETLQAIRAQVLKGKLDHTIARMLTDNVSKATATMKDAKQLAKQAYLDDLKETVARAEAVETTAHSREVADRQHIKH